MSHTRDVFRRLAMLGLALCVLIAGGTIAYALLEHRNAWHRHAPVHQLIGPSGPSGATAYDDTGNEKAGHRTLF